MAADPQVSALGEVYGGIAAFAYCEVLALAKLADDCGGVDINYGVLARRAFLDSAEHAKVVLGGMANLCLVDLQPSDVHGDAGVRVTVPNWTLWQFDPTSKDPTAAARQRRRRGRLRAVDSDNGNDRDSAQNGHGPRTPESVPEKRPGHGDVTDISRLQEQRQKQKGSSGAPNVTQAPQRPPLKSIDGGKGDK